MPKSKKEQIDELAKKFGWDDLKKKRMFKLVPALTMTMSFSCEDEHALMYADKKLGVSLEIITPKVDGQFQAEQRYYCINGDEREFKTPLELMGALYDKKFGNKTKTQVN